VKDSSELCIIFEGGYVEIVSNELINPKKGQIRMSNSLSDIELAEKLREFGFERKTGSNIYVDSCGSMTRINQSEASEDVGDDDDCTERVFECADSGKLVTYDVRSLYVGYSRSGRYNLVWAYEARDMNLHFPSKRILANIAQESVVVCRGTIVIETLERAIAELLEDFSGNFSIWSVQVIDDKNLLIDLRIDRENAP